MTHMLLSAVITLTPLDEAAAHASAWQVQAWFKDAFKALDPALFAQLHEPTVTRAYTLSRVYPACHDYPAWLRITSLEPNLSHLIQERLLPDAQQCGEIILDPHGRSARFAVQAIILGDEPRAPLIAGPVDVDNPAVWAGRTSYSALVNTLVRMPKVPPLKLELHFHTCTSFRYNAPNGFKIHLPLPVPSYVFQSYLRQWENFAPAQLIVDMAPFLEYYVWIAYHRIRMAHETFGSETRGKTPGFSGRATFKIAQRDDLMPELRRDWQHYVDMLFLLASFSFYCGTGIGIMHGLGQTLPLLPSSHRSETPLLP